MKRYLILLITIIGISSFVLFEYVWATGYPVALNIPPTNAFDHVQTSNDTISATNFSMPIKFKGINGIVVNGSNKTHTAIFSLNHFFYNRTNSFTGSGNAVLIYKYLVGSNDGSFLLDADWTVVNVVGSTQSVKLNWVDETGRSNSNTLTATSGAICNGSAAECIYEPFMFRAKANTNLNVTLTTSAGIKLNAEALIFQLN